ncbi:MAG: hypothetical protein D6679_08730 [Candidatus Hydrogenedentota bacterium]|nr:MAG: hypothetical protein D6679_08730 [Candidatus Hydrogenedentota bacterium]
MKQILFLFLVVLALTGSPLFLGSPAAAAGAVVPAGARAVIPPDAPGVVEFRVAGGSIVWVTAVGDGLEGIEASTKEARVSRSGTNRWQEVVLPVAEDGILRVRLHRSDDRGVVTVWTSYGVGKVVSPADVGAFRRKVISSVGEEGEGNSQEKPPSEYRPKENAKVQERKPSSSTTTGSKEEEQPRKEAVKRKETSQRSESSENETVPLQKKEREKSEDRRAARAREMNAEILELGPVTMEAPFNAVVPLTVGSGGEITVKFYVPNRVPFRITILGADLFRLKSLRGFFDKTVSVSTEEGTGTLLVNPPDDEYYLLAVRGRGTVLMATESLK